jgi:hypothetical protein
MSQHREWPATRPTRAGHVEDGPTALPPDRGALARGGTWVRDGTVICMPRRTRLALVRPQMLKAQAERPAGT